MFIGTIIGWIFAGLVVGAIARLLMPGRQNMGIIMTILLGIVGAMIGGFVSSMVFGPQIVVDGNDAYAVQTAWPGWIMAILGGVIVLWVARVLAGPDTTRPSV